MRTDCLGMEVAMEGDERSREYVRVEERLERLLMHETDFVAAMATTCCELHHSFKDHFDWTGFYRVAPEGDALVVGPYQGTHGCLRIPFGKGVCGAAASQRKTQLVPDVHAFPGHIACSSTTKSEIGEKCGRPKNTCPRPLLDSDTLAPPLRSLATTTTR